MWSPENEPCLLGMFGRTDKKLFIFNWTKQPQLYCLLFLANSNYLYSSGLIAQDTIYNKTAA